MRQEVKPFLRAVGAFTRLRARGSPAYTFRLHGRDCVLVECGIGARSAEEATRELLASHRPGVLVSFGVAGASTPGLHVGDVVMVDTVCRLDRGALVDCAPAAPWPAAAASRAEGALAARGVRLLRGTAVTTNGSASLPAGAHDIAPAVVEMETAGIMRAAAERGVPLFAIRTISDSPEEPLPFSIADAVDKDGRVRPGRVILRALRHPRLIPRLARLQRNMDRAMGNLAAAVVAAVEALTAD
jgi:nucleoside phosphorylase